MRGSRNSGMVPTMCNSHTYRQKGEGSYTVCMRQAGGCSRQYCKPPARGVHIRSCAASILLARWTGLIPRIPDLEACSGQVPFRQRTISHFLSMIDPSGLWTCPRVCATPSHGEEGIRIQEAASTISPRPAGEGAVRYICNILIP